MCHLRLMFFTEFLFGWSIMSMGYLFIRSPAVIMFLSGSPLGLLALLYIFWCFLAECIYIGKCFVLTNYPLYHYVCLSSISYYLCCPEIYFVSPWLVWLSGLVTSLRTKGSPVRFPVRAHAWVAGWVPSGEHVRGNHTLMFLFLSFSFAFPVSKNK